MQVLANDPDAEFNEAEKYWELEALYSDLSRFKGRSLSKREKQWLRGLLLGYSPQEIKQATCGCSNSNALRPGLSRMYSHIKGLIHDRTGYEVEKISGCRILVLLEKLKYRKSLMWAYQETSPANSQSLHSINAAQVVLTATQTAQNSSTPSCIL